MNKKVVYHVDGFPWLKAWAVDGDVIVKAQARMTVDEARDLVACLEAAIQDAEPEPIDPEILEDPEDAASRIAHKHMMTTRWSGIIQNCAIIECSCGWSSTQSDVSTQQARLWWSEAACAHGAYVALTERLAS